MKLENKNIAIAVVLSIVTCGIYAIIWNWKLGTTAAKIKDPNDSGTLEGILCIFLPFIGFYLAEKKFTEGCQMRGIPHEDKSIMYLIVGLFLAIVDPCIMQNEINKLADAGVEL